MKKLSGHVIARRVLAQVAAEIDPSHPPRLAVVLVGNDSASQIYVRKKRKRAREIGIETELHHLSADVSQESLRTLIEQLNHDARVNGILVQLPLPRHLNADAIIAAMDPVKDADGFHPQNREKTRRSIEPVLSQAVGAFVDAANLPCDPTERSAVVIVRKGSPLAAGVQEPLHERGLRVQTFENVAHARDALATASVVVIGLGGVANPRVLKGSMVQPGALLIDIGILRDPSDPKKIVGNVDPVSTAIMAGYRTPVPGGVGPLTIAFLLKNVLELQKLQLLQHKPARSQHV